MSQNADPQKEAEKMDAALQAPPPAETPQKHYEIDIFEDWCKACGICAAFCPRQCIHLNEEGRPVVDRADRCTGCGWCELHCPDFAICVREVAEKESSGKPGD
jgi:2-oxoglutarate ferredoxin oxidoreductase subunit delta